MVDLIITSQTATTLYLMPILLFLKEDSEDSTLTQGRE